MNNEQHSWAGAELDAVYPDADNKVRQAVTALLSVWTRVDVPLTDEQKAEAVKAFSNLALLRPLEKPVDETRVWGPASQYAASGVQYARVRLSNIADERHWEVEGRIGQVVALRRGIMTVKFDEPRSGAPDEFRGPVHDFEVDITHLTRSPR